MKKLDLLVASNALSANRNLISQLEEKGETDRVLYYTLKSECRKILANFPSLN